MPAHVVSVNDRQRHAAHYKDYIGQWWEKISILSLICQKYSGVIWCWKMAKYIKETICVFGIQEKFLNMLNIKVKLVYIKGSYDKFQN